MTKFSFQGIGTQWEIDIQDELSKDMEEVLLSKIKDRVEVFDKDYSRFREDSLVTKIREEPGVYKMPVDFDQMISVYKKAFEVTEGLVTPLIGKVLEDAGYDANYSLEKKEMTSPKKWEEVIEWQKPNLIIKEKEILDFGACGKGYLVDIISEILEEEGIKSYCVDGSGDMRQRSDSGESLKVGLEHPDDFSKVIGVANILNQSLCGSAGNRRKWADMHHIINPKTLKSPEEILSIWVIAGTTVVADILTTCLFFVSPEILKQHFDFEYLILYKDYSIDKSNGFKAEVF